MSPIPNAGVFAALLILILLFFNKEVDSVKLNYRLPSHIIPINYNITIKPYLNENDPRQFSFDGECYIEIQALQNTNEIQLHMKNLNISVGEYYRKDSAVKTALPQAPPHNLTDIVVYKLCEELQANVSYILHYIYDGIINEDTSGYYRSNYTTSNNVTKYIASTQFQTNNARRAIPSFDEPKFKATFDLAVTRHNSFNTKGPSSRIAVDVSGDYTTDIFRTTPKMSIYTLAFLVSEFTGPSDTNFGVLARPEYESYTNYSFDIGKRLLKAFDEYFDIPYYQMGIDKMHLAAIPDFAAGAMENWGLVTFRERLLLFDEKHSSLHSKQLIATVIAHEITHMWFGNLVTMVWWSDTFLSEGFATFFEYFGTDLVERKFDMPSQFVSLEVHTVMEKDASNDTNPMSDQDTNTPSDLGRMFNSISYSKGAAIIRMTEYIIGEEQFKESIRKYLKAHQYANTSPADLFKIWEMYWPAEYANYSQSYFSTYTTQVGFPVVTFNRINETTYQILQKRYLMMDFDTADPLLSYTVPITYTTCYEKNFTDFVIKFFLQQEPIYIEVSQNVSCIFGNIQEIGFYRVNYDIKTWHQIRRILLAENRTEIHVVNRAQIVDDVFKLARSGELDYDLAFSILDFMQYETEYLPWYATFNELDYLKARLGNETNDLARYFLSISNKVFNHLGFEEKENDTALDIYNRAKILDWICGFGHTECMAQAELYFNKNFTLEPVPPNIRYFVYCAAMRLDNEIYFNKLYYKYMNETVPTEKVLILDTLGCVKDTKLVSRFFHIVISNDVRRQDMHFALQTLFTKNYENVETVFGLVNQHLELLANSIGGYSGVARIISSIAKRFTTKSQLEKLQEFKDTHAEKFGSSSSKLQTAIEEVKSNLDWSKKNLGAVKSFLENRM